MRTSSLKMLLGASVLVCSFSASADKVIRFPEDELAQETVLPVFDKAPVVKNRTVKTAGRLELGGGMNWNLTEALYNPVAFGVLGTYYFNNLHALNVQILMNGSGLSDKGTQLKNGEGLSGAFFDASLAPQPKSTYNFSYQLDAFYGKISLTKQAVMNLSIYFLGGLSMVNYDKMFMGLNLGFGQRFYFGQNLALRFDMRMLIHQAPDPTSDQYDLDPTRSPLLGSPRSSGDLDKTMYYHSLATLSLVFLI